MFPSLSKGLDNFPLKIKSYNGEVIVLPFFFFFCIIYVFLVFLATPHCTWDLSSLTKIKFMPPALQAWSLNHGLPENSLVLLNFNDSFHCPKRPCDSQLQNSVVTRMPSSINLTL